MNYLPLFGEFFRLYMNIAIIGARGVPNFYGGFEQFAEYLSKGLVERGHQVTVYNSHTHPYQLSEWEGVRLVHRHDPEDRIGTAGQFIYDLNCILHTRKENYDLILQLGYTSSSVWGWLLPRHKSVVTTNMDGLEWKRSKYHPAVRWFLKKAESFATVFSDYWIADSLGIQDYLQKEYHIPSVYIPYGAFAFDTPDASALLPFEVEVDGYNMLIARLEPENNIETILDGVVRSAQSQPFLVIGKHETSYGEFLKNKYQATPAIRFVGGVYNMDALNNLRYYSNLYFHGHSVGGTNPSLLEAMASGAYICAHDNMFNRAILENDACYFSNAGQVADFLANAGKEQYREKVKNNIIKINELYNWNRIIDQYEQHFIEILKNKADI